MENAVVEKITAKFPNAKILVVEDCPVNQALTKELLAIMECQVEQAYNGKDAINTCQNNQYDIILMDLQMPKIDGYAATIELRGGGSTTPIIALTANSVTGDREKCLQSGMNDYLRKPIRGKDLQDILYRYVKNA